MNIGAPTLNSQNLEVALSHASDGRYIIPCRLSKKPYLKDWSNRATIELNTIKKWWDEWPDAIPGLPCGPNQLVVIDQDRHSEGVDGVSEWERLCIKNGLNQSACLIVATPSDGRHSYFTQGSGPPVGNSTGKIANGIDTRGYGGYVIAPGTSLPDGRRYQVVSGTFESSPSIPEGLRTFLGRRLSPAVIIPSDVPIAFTSACLVREQAYAAKALQKECERVRCAPIGQRNSALNKAVFALATMIPHYGITAETLNPLKMAARDAGLEEDEIETTFSSAMLAGYRQPRSIISDGELPQVDIRNVTCKGVPLNGPANNSVRQDKVENSNEMPSHSSAAGWKSLAELQHKIFPPLQWVVPGILPQGVTLLAGRPKLGKSWLALDLCLAVANGGEVLGSSCEAGDVFYAALEDTERRLKGRAERLASGQWPARFSYVHEMPRADEGGTSLVRSWLEQAVVPRLVVIDVLAKVRSGKGRDEGNYDADYNALTVWKALADEFDVAIVLVHHVRKMAADDPLEMVSGTNGLTGAADAILILNRDSQGCTLCGRGRDLDEFDRAVQFEPGTCRWNVLGTLPDVRRSDERKAILAFLSPTAPMSPSEIANAIGQPPNNVRFLLHKMVEAGEVEKTGRGAYIIPATAPNNANAGQLR